MRATRPVLLLAALAVGCGEPELFQVVAVEPPAGGAPLRLNQTLRVVFDRPADPSSIGAASFRLASTDGRPVRGRLEVDDRTVSFVPAPVATPALDDGGLPPGATLRLELPGFPARTGPLSADGRPLARRFTAEFEVVPPTLPPERRFVDVVPGAPPRLLGPPVGSGDGATLRVPAGAPLVLEWSEPLLPASVHPGTVRLVYANPDRTPVEARIELVQDAEWARVRLEPVQGFHAGTAYFLSTGEPGVRDLAGHESAEVRTWRVEVDAESAPQDGAVGGAGASGSG